MGSVGVWEWVGWSRVYLVWCWDSVGRAVDVPTRRYSTYPHQIPIQNQVFPTYTRPHTHHSPRSLSLPNPLPRQLYSSQTDPTLDYIHRPLYTIPPQPHPSPSQPDPPPHLNPIYLLHHTHSTSNRTLQTFTPPTPICPTLPQRLSSVLARRTCH